MRGFRPDFTPERQSRSVSCMAHSAPASPLVLGLLRPPGARSGPQGVGASSTGVPRFATPATLEWTLRVGACMCFFGHGAFAVITKAGWLPYFALAGIESDTAYRLMPLIGLHDISLGLLALFAPRPALTWWMLAWTLWTAMLRPLAAEPLWEMLERAGNYGVPAAMLALMATAQGTSRWRSWFGQLAMRDPTPATLTAAARVLFAALALLLVGHGALGLIGKAGLVANYASVLPANAAREMTPIIGALEIMLAGAVLLWPARQLLLAVAAWKLLTEMLFLAAGAPVWEVIEGGGSYAVPVALAIVLSMRGSRVERSFVAL